MYIDMCKMKDRFTGIFGIYFCIFLLLGVAHSLDEAEESSRIERAILGGSSRSQDVVGGGSPGKDFPALSAIPRSDYPCGDLTPGYYADEEYGCQVFHICQADRGKDTFLCPNGTIFDQQKLVCDWWFNVDCSTSSLHFSVNEEIGKVPPARADKQSTTPPRDPFTTVSSFTQTPRRTTSSFTTQPTTERIQTIQHFPGGESGIPLDTFSNLGDQDIGINLADVQGVRVGARPAIERQRQPEVSSIPARGVSLQSVTNTFDSARRTSFQSSRNQVRDEISSVVSGVPLKSISDRERTSSVQRIPDHFTAPKQSKPSLNVDGRGSRGRVSSGRRVTINKRPLGTTDLSSVSRNTLDITTSRDSKPLTIQQAARPGSRSRAPVRSNVVTQDQKIRTFDIAAQDVAILDDKKVSTQFFNIGAPRVVPSRQPSTSSRGRPLPINNLQPGSRTFSAIENTGGRELPLTSVQPGLRRSQIGRPLSSTNVQQDSRRGQLGRPLPATDNQLDLTRSEEGRPLPLPNAQPALRGNQQGRPLPSSNFLPALSRGQQGRPLPSPNAQPAVSRSQQGRPLPSSNFQPALGRGQQGRPLPSPNALPALSRSQQGRPLPSSNFQSTLSRGQQGRPLPSPNAQPAISRSQQGRPLPSSNFQPTLSRGQQGRPLPSPNAQPALSRSQEGRPLPSSNAQPALRSQQGRPLPSSNAQPALSRRQQGRPLPSTGVQPDLTRNQIGRPLSATNFEANSILGSQQFSNNLVRTQPRITVNRGSARFSTSERNRARISQAINNRNRAPRIQVVTRPLTTRVSQPIGFIRDFDDDDLDDLNDPFDDDRFDFDDDRFDDDRFDKPDLDDILDDIDDRFDDDRFDRPDLDDRFDFDDRFDDDPFDLDDRFDDDRFDKPDLDDILDDFDDRFDNDPFDDDPFDDDRFDLDDRFDDRFDFDDEIFDDRRERFDNDDNFNFGRITRGSTFTETDDANPSEIAPEKEEESKIAIEPPSEIQLPPPPR